MSTRARKARDKVVLGAQAEPKPGEGVPAAEAREENPQASAAQSPTVSRDSTAIQDKPASADRKRTAANAAILDPKPTTTSTDKAADNKQAEQAGHKKKRSWNALERYYSEAHSFPDYGSSKNAMGVGFLKKINQSNGPVNTLSTGSRRKFSDEHSSPNGVDAKRQKRETQQTSPYFAKPKPPKQAAYDLTADGSQDDVYDIRSISSSGPSNQHAASGISEYRNAEPKSKTTPNRRRKSREAKSSLFRPGSSSSDIISSAKHATGPKSSAYQTIPDDESEAPPARVVSDIPQPGRNKKGGLLNAPQIFRSEPQPRRQRPNNSKETIDVSEDELQVAQVTPSGPVRRTNFSNIAVSPRHKQKFRGDITPTDFTKSKGGGERSAEPLQVVKAASGKCTYDAAESSMPPISLRQSRDNQLTLEVVRNGKLDKQHPWLTISINKVGKVHYHGRHVSLHRSMEPGISPKLSLKLATVEGARLLLSLIGRDAIECNLDHMKRMMETAWNDAKKCQKDAELDSARASAAAARKTSEGRGPRKEDDSNSSKSASEPRREKLKDRMQTGDSSAKDEIKVSNDEVDASSPWKQRAMRTRSAKRSSAAAPCDPEDMDSYKWSKVNRLWAADWKQTLVYPPTGRNRASVEYDDIGRLDNCEFVNDNLLSFYIRYVQDRMARERPDLVSRVHIFSTFFYEKLYPEGGMNYAGVRNWTNKVDIFSYDYNIIPVNENNHWYLAIICHAPKLIELAKQNATTINDEEDEDRDNENDLTPQEKPPSLEMGAVESQMSDISLNENKASRRSTRQTPSGQLSSPLPDRARDTATPDSPKRGKGRQTVTRKLDPTQPRILILDSFGATHDSTRKVLKDYLVEEAMDKKKIDLTYLPAGAATVVPQQSNFWDCGVFAMGYVEQFLKDPDEASRLLILRQTTGWPIHPPQLRAKVRNLIFDLQKEQTERLAKEREEKRQAARERKAAARLKAAEATSSASSDAGKATAKDDTPKGTPQRETGATSTNGQPSNQTGAEGDAKAAKDDSGASVKSKSEEFYSAKSSPDYEQQKMREPRRERVPFSARLRRSRSPVFVKPLPCTSDEDNGDEDDKSTVDGTQDSIEIVEARETKREPAKSKRSQSTRRA